MRRRRHTWLWKCVLCGHLEYDGDGLGALEGFERHYIREHLDKSGETT